MVKVILFLILLTGCGKAVDPTEVQGPTCISDICWDLTNVSLLKVNDLPTPDRLVSQEVHGWKFPTVPGHKYTVKVKISSGSAQTYVSSNVLIDPRNNQLNDYYSNSGITFIAQTGTYYIAVWDSGNVRGTDYTVRIISYDENLDPLAGTIQLTVNDLPKAYQLVPGDIVRFDFNGIRGGDYTVKVQVTGGVADTFLSRIPSVDSGAYELAGYYPYNSIKFRAVETAIYYIGVADRGSATGSNFSIQVTSP